MEPSTSGAFVWQWVEAIEKIAPPEFAEPWDNVGLLVGDAAQRVNRALLTIDYTSDVAREAQAADVDAIIAYHPPIFAPLKRINAGGVIHDAIRRGVAIYSPHTSLDSAIEGTNDVLCDVLGVGQNRRPLRPRSAEHDELKLVVFVPPEQAEAVSQAMFSAGAGRIGNYASCSFRGVGTGTFFVEQGAQPAAGEPGKLQQVAELRRSTWCRSSACRARSGRDERGCWPFRQSASSSCGKLRARSRCSICWWRGRSPAWSSGSRSARGPAARTCSMRRFRRVHSFTSPAKSDITMHCAPPLRE